MKIRLIAQLLSKCEDCCFSLIYDSKRVFVFWTVGQKKLKIL